MLLPPKLKRNDKVKLIAPAGAVDKDKFDHLIEIINSLGLQPVWTEKAISRFGYFSANDKDRLQDLINAFLDNSIKAVFCLRGGYGSTRLLDKIPYYLIRQNPKIFLGFSDITALQMAFFKKTKLITFHTSLNALDFDYTRERFVQMTFFSNTMELDISVDFAPKTIVLNEGKAKGVLLGGNLSLLISLIGTNFLPKFKNRIVFLEEISEPPYKIDRMLTHLLMATDIHKATGVILGIFNKCDWQSYYKNKDKAFSLYDIFRDRFKDFSFPIVYGFPLGHQAKISILPMGAEVELDTQNLKLRLLKPVVK